MAFAPDGSLWVTATGRCGRGTDLSSPVWHGTPEHLEHYWPGAEALQREAAGGGEGDFAFDDAGNVYFADMVVQSGAHVTSIGPDGHVRWAAPFISSQPDRPYLALDRPWLVAGEEDVVHLFFADGNGLSKRVTSVDGGRTWDRLGIHTFPCNFAMPARADESHLVAAAACGGELGAMPWNHYDAASVVYWESSDGGDTWSDGLEVPPPEGQTWPADRVGWNVVPAFTSNGTLALTFTAGSDAGVDVFLATRAPNGTWMATRQISAGGWNVMPWVSAGPGMALAWYAGASSDGPWHVMAAVGPAFHPLRVDEAPVFEGGPIQDTLGDFLTVDLDGAGTLAVGYSRQDTGEPRGWVASAPLSGLRGVDA